MGKNMASSSLNVAFKSVMVIVASSQPPLSKLIKVDIPGESNEGWQIFPLCFHMSCKRQREQLIILIAQTIAGKDHKANTAPRPQREQATLPPSRFSDGIGNAFKSRASVSGYAFVACLAT
jgi:hypothetical protein